MNRQSPQFAEEFDAFYAATCYRLLGQVYAFCGDLADAEECLQEAYVRAWQRWRRLSTYDEPVAWVRQVAFRLTTGRWRRKVTSRRHAHRLAQSVDVAGPSDDTVTVVALLRRLPTAQREALVLHYLADLPVADIAVRLGVPEGTVKARLARGRAALQAQSSREKAADG